MPQPGGTGMRGLGLASDCRRVSPVLVGDRICQQAPEAEKRSVLAGRERDPLTN